MRTNRGRRDEWEKEQRARGGGEMGAHPGRIQGSPELPYRRAVALEMEAAACSSCQLSITGGLDGRKEKNVWGYLRVALVGKYTRR
jgi:hypothetical protein